MKKVEITTTQNVTFEYNIATVMERIVAWFLDIIFISLASLILGLILGAFNLQNQTLYYIFIAPISIFYSLVMEVFNNGQSLGKMIMNIRVMKLTGEIPGISDYLTRWAFRLIDITMSFGTIAILTIISSVHGQRLGDMLSDMVVIKLQKVGRFGLNRVLDLNKLSDYTPVYPEVTLFNEEDMVLIKETMERYRQYPTKGHKEALELLLKKIQEKLQIDVPADKMNFLRTLIKDYVTLTR